MTTQTARDAVITALRAAGKPQTVAEIRSRIRDDFGVTLHRDTVYKALVWLSYLTEVDYHETPGKQAYAWYAVPVTDA